jgi:hypothetical protein
MFRRRAVNNLNNNKSPPAVRPPNDEAAARLNGSTGGAAHGPQAASRMSVAGALLDYSFMLFLVIGGCCSYVSTSLQHTQVFMPTTAGMSGLTRNCFAQSLMSVRMSRPPTHSPILQLQPSTGSLPNWNRLTRSFQGPHSRFRKCSSSQSSSYRPS